MGRMSGTVVTAAVAAAAAAAAGAGGGAAAAGGGGSSTDLTHASVISHMTRCTSMRWAEEEREGGEGGKEGVERKREWEGEGVVRKTVKRRETEDECSKESN